MICTWECTSTEKDISLLLLWRKCDRQELSIPSSGTPRTVTKTSSSRARKFSPSRSSITNATRFMLKHPLKCIVRLQGGHPPSYVMVGWEVSHQGWHSFIFVSKGWNGCLKCIKRMCYKELWNILTWPSSVVRNGSSSRTQFLPNRPRQFRSGCRWTSWPSSALRIGFRGVQTSNPGQKNCGLFWRTWHAESITTA